MLTWNKAGEISYRGHKVPHPNIVNLISESQRQKALKQCWSHLIWVDDRLSIYQIHIRPATYIQSTALIDGINEGLERTLKKERWEALVNPQEDNSMKLMYFENVV